jgi:hypothetical protein
MRSNGKCRWIVDLVDIFRGSEQTIRWRWIVFNVEIVGVLGEYGGNIALFDNILQFEFAFSLQLIWVDWEQYEQRYETEPKLIRLRH